MGQHDRRRRHRRLRRRHRRAGLALVVAAAGREGGRSSTTRSAPRRARTTCAKAKDAMAQLADKYGGTAYAPRAALIVAATLYDAGDKAGAKAQLAVGHRPRLRRRAEADCAAAPRGASCSTTSSTTTRCARSTRSTTTRSRASTPTCAATSSSPPAATRRRARHTRPRSRASIPKSPYRNYVQVKLDTQGGAVAAAGAAASAGAARSPRPRRRPPEAPPRAHRRAASTAGNRGTGQGADAAPRPPGAHPPTRPRRRSESRPNELVPGFVAARGRRCSLLGARRLRRRCRRGFRPSRRRRSTGSRAARSSGPLPRSRQRSLRKSSGRSASARRAPGLEPAVSRDAIYAGVDERHARARRSRDGRERLAHRGGEAAVGGVPAPDASHRCRRHRQGRRVRLHDRRQAGVADRRSRARS